VTAEVSVSERPSYAWYIYELAWILPSVALPVGMLSALLVTAFGAGVHLPGNEGRVAVGKLATTAPFDHPGVVQVAPGRYEARVVGQVWSFTPNEIHVPAGSEVTFVATSRDVIHGFYVAGANINMMLVPGQISRQTARVDGDGRVRGYYDSREPSRIELLLADAARVARDPSID
jgi:cytochrome c oxidase subunit 2